MPSSNDSGDSGDSGNSGDSGDSGDSGPSNGEPDAPQPTGKARIAPVAPGERIQALDVIRGFAIFGILVINVLAFVRPVDDSFRFDWDSLGSVDHAIAFVRTALVQGKFYTMFSILFGIGFAIQLRRIKDRGGLFAPRYLWRMVLLFAIGAAHEVLIWNGDILSLYAMCGVVLVVFLFIKRAVDFAVRKLSRGRWQKLGPVSILIAAAFYLVGPMTVWAVISHHSSQLRAKVAAGTELTEKQQERWDEIQKRESPEKKAERQEKSDTQRALISGGTYAEVVEHRFERLIETMPQRLPQLLLFTSLFLLGAYIGRRNFIGRAEELRKGFVKLLVCGLAIGLPAAIVFAWITATSTEDTRLGWLAYQHGLSGIISGYALSLAYMAAIVLLMQGKLARWLNYLAPVGRMALSNYILSSVLGTLFFYGYGLGMMKEFGPAGSPLFEMIFVLGAFGLQVALSHLWLRHFRYGPLEWLWRSLSYLSWQPMRQTGQTPL